MPVVAIFRAGSVEVQLNEKIDSLRRTKHTRGQRENNDKDPAKGIRPWDYSNGTFGIEHLTALGLFFSPVCMCVSGAAWSVAIGNGKSSHVLA